MLKTDKNMKDILYILKNLRDEDQKEVVAIWGDDWTNKFLENTMKTDFLILLNRNIPIAMGGFVPVLNENFSAACVWLLCSKDVINNRFLLLKTLKEQIEKESKNFDIFYNYIYKSNVEAKEWLKKLGFKFNCPFTRKLNIQKDFEFFYKKNK